MASNDVLSISTMQGSRLKLEIKGPPFKEVIRNVCQPIFSSYGTFERILRFGSARPVILGRISVLSRPHKPQRLGEITHKEVLTPLKVLGNEMVSSAGGFERRSNLARHGSTAI